MSCDFHLRFNNDMADLGIWVQVDCGAGISPLAASKGAFCPPGMVGFTGRQKKTRKLTWVSSFCPHGFCINLPGNAHLCCYNLKISQPFASLLVATFAEVFQVAVAQVQLFLQFRFMGAAHLTISCKAAWCGCSSLTAPGVWFPNTF